MPIAAPKPTARWEAASQAEHELTAMPWDLTQRAVLALALAGCQQASPASDRVSLALAGSGERRVTMRDVVIEPADNVQSARIDARGTLTIERVDQARSLHVTAPDWCPVSIAAGPQAAAAPLLPVLELGGDRTGVGFDTRFQVQVRHNCLPEQRGQIAWRQLAGPALADLQVSDGGFTLSARTARFAEVHPEPAADGGIVPISPRTQGRVVLEASWAGSDGQVTTRTLTISAAARATGLSSIAVSQPIVLAGTGWSVQKRPAGGHASLRAADGLTFFTADASGSWTLEQDHARTLKLHALTHDATPYDCGRAECHAAISAHTASSPMSRALAEPLSMVTDSAATSCMLDCHVLGERGLSDGGFRAVAARLGFTWNEHTRWDDLPQALRRLGGVRCSACHGPGAIPPPEQRSAILASDVCASCHDAPPRYVHVAQWRSGRMASSDREPATRQEPCAQCHTTAGFLAHVGDRKISEEPPPRAEPVGIACAACHAPHSAERGARLIRNVNVKGDAAAAGELFPEPSTTLCRSCHAPLSAAARAVVDTSTAHVAAASGTLWASQVAVPAQQGAGWETLRSRSVHDQVPRGCVGCHGGGALAQGAVDHSFRAEPRACATCHADDALKKGRAATAQLRARAQALLRALAPHCHNADDRDSARCSNSSLERAHYEINLVLDDAAALFHNADLSRALLNDAEKQLSDHAAL
jgi:hypothetical protein